MVGEENRRIVAETFEPGASVSVVARRHDVNADMLFTWRRQTGAAASSAEALIAHLRLAIEKMKRELYGSRSERGRKLLNQMELELEELEATAAEDEAAAELAAGDDAAPAAPRAGRQTHEGSRDRGGGRECQMAPRRGVRPQRRVWS